MSFLQDGPLPVMNGVDVTPINGRINLSNRVHLFFHPISGVKTLLITGRGPAHFIDSSITVFVTSITFIMPSKIEQGIVFACAKP